MKSKVFSYIAVACGIICFVLSLVAFLFSSVDLVSANETKAVTNEAISTGAQKGDVVREVTVKKVKEKNGEVTIKFDESELSAHLVKVEKTYVYIFTIISLVFGIACVYLATLRTEWKPGVVRGISSLAKIGLMIGIIVLLATLKNPTLFG